MIVRQRLRVELPDELGALARVVTLLAGRGADVISVDIHELDSGRAIDEIIVKVDDDWDLAGFGSELERTGAGALLAAATSGPGPDRVVAALQWARHLVETGVQHSDLELSSTIAQLCSASTAWVGPVEDARLEALAEEAVSCGRPVVREVDELPRRLTPDGPEPGWLLAVPDDPQQPRRIALVARPLTLRFSATEISRIEALLGLAHELSYVR